MSVAKKSPLTSKPAVSVIALIVGLGIGGAMAGGKTSPQVSAPTMSPQVSAPTMSPRSVERTPQSCLKALDIAAEAFSAIGTEHAEMGAAFQRAGNGGDIITFASEITAAMKKATGAMTSRQSALSAAASDCRSKA